MAVWPYGGMDERLSRHSREKRHEGEERNLRVSNIFSLDGEDERTGVRRDGRTCVGRPKSQSRKDTGKISVSLFS